MTQKETEFSTKEPTIATLQNLNGHKEDNGNIKVDFWCFIRFFPGLPENA